MSKKQRNGNGTSSERRYRVRVLNASNGTEEYVSVPESMWRRNVSLWPTYAMYVVGFGLLGLSFIAHTLRLYPLFVLLLAASGVVTLGTATSRFIRAHRA